MSAVRAEAPQVEWLSADQLAAVDPHELVGTTELLGHAGGVCDPWPARLREAGHAYLEATAEQVWTVVLRSRRWAHDLQRPADLRHHSEVAHHLNSSFEEVVDRLAGPIAGQAGGVRLRCEPGAVTTGPVRFDAEGSLRLPASFPELPVRLSVEPWWRDRCVVGLSLRSSRRIRYPRRYFVAAHRVLSALVPGSARP